MAVAYCVLKLRHHAIDYGAILQRRFQGDAENLLLRKTRTQFPHETVAQRHMVDAYKRQPEAFGQVQHSGERGKFDLVLGRERDWRSDRSHYFATPGTEASSAFQSYQTPESSS